MKKIAAILLAAMLLFTLAACNNENPGGTNGNGTNGNGTNGNNGGATGTAAYKTGLGVDASMTSTEVSTDTEGGTKASVTTCAATFDADGKIVSVTFDTVECKSTVDTNGKITLPENFKSKKALGDAYNMKKHSSIGKEWYEQVDALENYCVGKTASEVTGMAVKTTDGHADVPDVPELTSSCTISCTQFFTALTNANTNAKSSTTNGTNNNGTNNNETNNNGTNNNGTDNNGTNNNTNNGENNATDNGTNNNAKNYTGNTMR